MTQSCPLCSNFAASFFLTDKQHFYRCNNCRGIFMDRDLLPSKTEEEIRYKEHTNHLEDHGYIKFADPILSSVRRNFNSTHQGLDFGAGHTPVISELLKADGFQVEIHDPIFFNNPEIYKNTYDFITSCEVIEHFFDPKKEFEDLYRLLKPGGKLICMTDIYKDGINFDKWYYKNDPTHVFIFQEETFMWIRKHLNFLTVNIENRLITFTK